MHFWIRLTIISVLLASFVFLAAFLFILSDGKPMLISQLERLTHRQVTIGSLSLSPTFEIKIKDLEVRGLAKIDSLVVSPNLKGFLLGSLAFNNIKIIRPHITYTRSVPRICQITMPTSSTSPNQQQPYIKLFLRLMFRRVQIQDGSVDFLDRCVGTEGIHIYADKLNFLLTNLYIQPRSAITQFQLSGFVPHMDKEWVGRIKSEGWFDLYKMNMQATVKVEDINGIYLYPYYAKWLDLDQAGIEKAKFNFTSNINGLNNNLVAECRLELTDILRKPSPSGESGERAQKITNEVLSRFKAEGEDKIVLDFPIKTRVDRPVFGFQDIKLAIERKLLQGNGSFLTPEAVLAFPFRLVRGVVTGFVDMTSAVVVGTVTAGVEVGKSVGGAFKKEK